MRRPCVLSWGISSFFGWGVYGLNLALNWANDAEIEPLCALPVRTDSIVLDALGHLAMQPFVKRSAEVQAKLAMSAGRNVQADVPVLLALGNDFTRPRAAHAVALEGQPSIGVVFFELAPLAPEVIARARQFPLIIAGSSWNAEVLADQGIPSVRTVLQGVDPCVFHPAPAAAALPGRFLIFSGGKLEFRKGQDIVLAAFRTFAARHPEAMLITAWHSPWPALARSLDASRLVAPVVLQQDSGRIDVKAWAAASGINPDQVLDLGQVPNALMAPVLRQMDVALFPNRAEGGTNLVAMECMACGVPVILAANTGHLDLITEANCYALGRQRPVAGEAIGIRQTAGWGESDLEEVDACLEQVFADRAEATRRGAAAAAMLAKLTWTRTAAQVKALVSAAA